MLELSSCTLTFHVLKISTHETKRCQREQQVASQATAQSFLWFSGWLLPSKAPPSELHCHRAVFKAVFPCLF